MCIITERLQVYPKVCGREIRQEYTSSVSHLIEIPPVIAGAADNGDFEPNTRPGSTSAV
jgi:hypothetical protein